MCFFKRFEKRHEALKHTREGTSETEEKPNKNVSPTLQISQYEEIVKECSKELIRHSICIIAMNVEATFGTYNYTLK